MLKVSICGDSQTLSSALVGPFREGDESGHFHSKNSVGNVNFKNIAPVIAPKPCALISPDDIVFLLASSSVVPNE